MYSNQAGLLWTAQSLLDLVGRLPVLPNQTTETENKISLSYEYLSSLIILPTVICDYLKKKGAQCTQWLLVPP